MHKFGALEATRVYDVLSSRYLTPPEKLYRYGLPRKDPYDPTKRFVEPDVYGGQPALIDQPPSHYKCDECKQQFPVDSVGRPLPGICYYHPGKIKRFSGEPLYLCCMKSEHSRGCRIRDHHVNEGKLELCKYTDYVETQDKPHLDPNKHGVFSVDCEMVYTTRGLELAKVSIVDHNMEIVYDKFVKPTNPIIETQYELTGISEHRLYQADVISLKEVQRDLLDLFSSKTIIIGHSLESDMEALKMFHQKIIDTSILYPCRGNWRYGLKRLAEMHLGEKIQSGHHNSAEDARAAMKLVLIKASLRRY